jgi:outer membrane lipoprotein-sorting protein
MRRVIFVKLMALCLCSAVVHAATLEDIEAKMKGQWESLKSVSSDTETVMEQAQTGYSMKSVTTGTYEMVRNGEVWKYRMESTGTTTTDIGGTVSDTKSETVSVNDGATMLTYSLTNGQPSATKMKAPKTDVTTIGMFDGLKDTHDIKILPDETVDGVACWVLEATAKQKTAGQDSAMRWFIGQSDGQMRLMESIVNGKKIMTTKIKNVKVNPSIADSRFTYTVPAGVPVTDLDALNAQSQQAAQQQPAKEEPAEKKETAAAKEEPAKTETAEPKKEDPKTEEPKKEKKKKVKIPGF